MTLTLDKEELEIPAEGGTFRVKIDCKVPVTLEKPGGYTRRVYISGNLEDF